MKLQLWTIVCLVFVSLKPSAADHKRHNLIQGQPDPIRQSTAGVRESRLAVKKEPLRILFDTTRLNDDTKYADATTQTRKDAIIDRVLPEVAKLWANTLSVNPLSNMIVPKSVCLNMFDVPLAWSDPEQGLNDVDLLIFISGSDFVRGRKVCDETNSILAGALPCKMSSEDSRPFIGSINICLSTIAITTNGGVHQSEVDTAIKIISHELVHILGLNSDFFKHYRNSVTGEPLTPGSNSRYSDSGRSQTIEAKCVNDRESQDLIMPCRSNTLQYIKPDGEGRKSQPFYEIILPTVRQVTRNHFNCQTLKGARLENQPTNPFDCAGSHFEERTWFTELMSANLDRQGAVFSPLTLALLEDTGWYKSDFTTAENSPFGLGAGCDFVNEDCIVNDEVPSYGRGFFCDDLSKDQHCGVSHQYKAICDLTQNRYSGRQYFTNADIGPAFFTHADYCPLNTFPVYRSASGGDSFISCDDRDSYQSYPIEVFGSNSKCIDVTVDSAKGAMCLRSSCNEENQTFEFEVSSKTYTCETDFQEIAVSNFGQTYQLTCPRLTQVCPHMFCPGMCSGKGICDWSLSKPACQCFDKTDQTPGCYESNVNEAEACTDEIVDNDDKTLNPGFRMSLSIVAFSISVLASIAM